jgi:hypothetical protein
LKNVVQLPILTNTQKKKTDGLNGTYFISLKGGVKISQSSAQLETDLLGG